MQAFLIDAANGVIRPVDYTGLSDLQMLVGGYIEPAYSPTLPDGDVLYVDEEGLLKNPGRFFMLEGNPQPLAGNGVVVGPEIDKRGNFEGTRAPRIALEALRQLIRFGAAV